jgi:peroxiredoxin/Skp family chaperone for outer membrane proteins
MKTRILAALLIFALALSLQTVGAADKSAASTELDALIAKIRTKLGGKTVTEADLAPELKEFDDLLAKHKDEKTDDVAQILLMKAVVYQQVLKDEAKGDALMAQLQKDFPDSKQARTKREQETAQRLRASLVDGAKFPDFDVKDTAGKPLSISNYKGKVLLLDFWATWCGPCVHELPNVIKAYDAYHSKGFEIIGVSLDKDEQKLAGFTKEKKMAWAQYFDGLVWQNKLAVKYGINSIPATFLLDGEGKIIGRDLRGEALDQAVAKALDKK